MIFTWNLAQVVAGVADVLRIYRCRDEWRVMEFFLRKCHALGHRRPLDLIRSGQAARVVEYVRTYPKRMRGKLLPTSEFAIRDDDEMLRVPDFEAMRRWRGKRVIVRAMVLLAFFGQSLGSGWLRPWLERPNPQLNGELPIDLITKGQWKILGDLVDDMLTGDTA